MSWPTRSLRDCGKWLSGGTPPRNKAEYWGGDLPWISSKSLKSFELHDAEEKLTEEGAANGSKAVEPGTILFVVRGMSLANEFRVGVTTRRVAFNQDLKGLVPREDVDSRYLTHFLRSAWDEIQARMDSAAHGTKRLATDKLETLMVPLPPLPEQKRIAAILDKADEIRRKRAEAIKLTEELLKSAFLEMFGDPVTNPKGWEVVSLAEAVAQEAPVTYGIVQPGPECIDGMPYIKTGDIKDGRILVQQLQRAHPDVAKKYRRSEVVPGDLVFSIRATVGTVASVPRELGVANLTQGTARIRAGAGVHPDYLLQYLRTEGLQRWVWAQVKGATFKEITLQRLREMPVLRPPMSLQTSFAALTCAVSSSAAQRTLGAQAAEDLAGALTQRAFRGEL